MARRLLPALVIVCFVAACGSQPAGSAQKGPVDVLYAGSLVNLMENKVGPDFDKATGYGFSGFSGGSKALATDISGKVRKADVFASAAPAVNASLEGTANGNWVSWYAAFGKSPLLLGYNPKSRFASQLQTKPWYQVVTQSGFLLGRTDPATDPKGVLAVQALAAAATQYNNPALLALTKSTANVFPEETLVGRLQAGQLDAGFFYSVEAHDAHIPTLSLAPIDLAATYTITVVNRAPHSAGADAFINFLLGAQGRALLSAEGLTLIRPPKVTGSGIPGSVRSVLT